MKPLAIGWYAVLQIDTLGSDSNWDARFVVTMEETPNVEIQPLTKACAHVSAVMSVIGMASDQRANRSLQVWRYGIESPHYLD